MKGPDPNTLYPLENYEKLCFLKNIIKNPNIIVGEYTYYDDFNNPLDFEKNVLYHYDFMLDKLIIGKFCAIASGVKFIMNGANHELKPFSTFPFSIFRNGWEKILENQDYSKKFPSRGDTIIGNDVWIGLNSTIMPGVKIGSGSIIGSCSVVARDIPPYSIAAGNPAVIKKKRFSKKIIKKLLEIAWWDWDAEKITRNLALINGNNIEALLQCR